MGVRVTVTMTGAGVASEDLKRYQARIDAPMGPLLQAIGAHAGSYFRQRIATGSLDLPIYELATVRIRDYYGHGQKKKLVRGGDLLNSITALESSETAVQVGSQLSYAHVLHEGGVVTEKSGRTHTVQPFPFLLPDEDLRDDVAGMVEDYFLPEAAVA